MIRLALILILLAFPAWGRPGPCLEHQAIADRLGEKYGETVRVQALTSDGGVMETFASDKGTWTIIVTYPNGCSVAVLEGDSFTLMPVVPQKAGLAL